MKQKGIAIFMIALLVIGGLATLTFYGIPNINGYKVPSVFDEGGITKGLDLVGGSSITYEADTESPTDDQMNSAVAMLRERLDNLGYYDATIQRRGDKKVLVEIPAITNPEEAVQKIGQTAKLEFRDADGNVLLDGSDVKSASAEYGQMSETSQPEQYVSLTLKSEAVEKWAEATRNAAARAGETDENGRAKNYISIVLDDEVQSSPNVKEEINSDTCVISGGFSAEKAKWLANIISAGQLPFALMDVELRSVGPTLGEKAFDLSMWAALIGILLVMIYMIIWYRLSGVMACIALVFYITLTIMILSPNWFGLDIALTLPGIAGIILSVGMAVDANVIIFERIKEELKNGKTVRASVDAGFKRAMSAIIDGNVTTLIAAVILWLLGSGSVKGFAVTLFIGIIISMFTAIVITRVLIRSMMNMGVRNPWLYGVRRRDINV